LIVSLQVFPDEWHKRKVLCLKVKCSQSKDGCKWNGQLRDLDEHLKKCEYTRVSCEYESMGCIDQVLPREMDQHIKNNVAKHMKLLRKRIENLEKENARLRAERWTKSHSCTFFWRIQNWRLKMEQAAKGDTIQLHSEPFYSDIPGQKLRMEVFPSGDERSKGRYLSVFLRILKGDYDSIVSWPFAKQCKVTIMSQQSDTRDKDVSRSVNLARVSQALKDETLQRPEFEEHKRSFGFSNFIPLETLTSGSFLLGNCLLIKAVIST
jgi:TNF receptor-associated factor 4